MFALALSDDTGGRNREVSAMGARHIFFVIRYSVLVAGMDSWRLASQDLETYRRKLFDERRLEERVGLFERLTLPSIMNQIFDENVSVSLVVITSAELPANASRALDEALTKRPAWLGVDVVRAEVDGPGLGALTQSVIDSRVKDDAGGSETIYATVRLDDDDVLSCGYVAALARYMTPTLAGMIVTFPKGYVGTLSGETGRFNALRHYYAPKIALGLAHIGKSAGGYPTTQRRNIFECGRHTEVDRVLPVISDASFDAFIRTFHGSNDSGAASNESRWIQELPVASAGAPDQFPHGLVDRGAVGVPDEENGQRLRYKECERSFARLRVCQKEKRRLKRKRKARGWTPT